MFIKIHKHLWGGGGGGGLVKSLRLNRTLKVSKLADAITRNVIGFNLMSNI